MKYPIQRLLEAGEPVLSGVGVFGEVHCVGDVGGRILQQGQVDQLPLQPVHLQHVKLRTGRQRRPGLTPGPNILLRQQPTALSHEGTHSDSEGKNSNISEKYIILSPINSCYQAY